jgi:hypothetical protein
LEGVGRWSFVVSKTIGPATGAVKDREDLDFTFVNSVRDQERRIGDDEFASGGNPAFAAQLWELAESFGGLQNALDL